MLSKAFRFTALLTACWFAAEGMASAQAQPVRVIPSVQQINALNPFTNYVAPGITQAQYLNNISMYAKAISQVPPWALGYNPYPQTVVTPFSVVNPASSAALYSPYGVGAAYGGGYGAAVASPYGAGAATTGAGYGASPYSTTPLDPAAYSPYYNSPYNYNPYGGELTGAADVMRAYGSIMNAAEQARLAREMANQAKLDTQKKKFDTEMYIRANTPTATEVQAKVMRETLKRIQINSNAAEIASGKSENYLLDDLRKYPGAKIASDPISLSDSVLSRVNVTRSYGNVGILRNGGILRWPLALQEIVPTERQKEIDNQAQALYKDAANGRLDINRLKDFSAELEVISDQLAKKINDIPSTQYLEAKRFLNDAKDARVALEKGDVPTFAAFQKYVSGGKAVSEVTDYMVKNGLRFAPAVYGDEDAYQALFSAMVAYDVAMNSQNPTVGADYKEPTP